MKHFRAILLLVSIAASAALSAAQTNPRSDEPPPPPPPPAAEYNPKSWREFSPEGRGFSVLLPGTPTESVQSVDSPIGKLDVHTFTLRTFAQYGVTYIDFPLLVEDEARTKQLLNIMRDGGVRAVNGTLVEDKEISFDGHPGRHFKVQVGGGHIMRVRMYLVKSRLYQLEITMRDKDAPEGILKFHEETAAKFLDSFKLLSTESAPGTAEAEGEVDKLLKSLREKGQVVYSVYKYKGAEKETLVYDENGKINQKRVATLDDKGNEVEESHYDVDDGKIDGKYSYTYEYDAKGNWTKKTETKWVEKDGKAVPAPDSVTYRTITYY